MLPLVKLFRYSNVNVSGQVRSHPPDTRRTGRQMTVFYQKTVALFRAEPDSGSLPVFGRRASVARSRVELTCAETSPKRDGHVTSSLDPDALTIYHSTAQRRIPNMRSRTLASPAVRYRTGCLAGNETEKDKSPKIPGRWPRADRATRQFHGRRRRSIRYRPTGDVVRRFPGELSGTLHNRGNGLPVRGVVPVPTVSQCG